MRTSQCLTSLLMALCWWGQCDPSGLLPLKFSPATMTLSELACNAKEERALLRYSVPSVDQDDAIAASVWKQAMEETIGALLGPFQLSDIDESIALSRRFGIKQGGKIRCVDDFSRSGINACCSTSESPRPHTIDVIASLA